MAEPTARLKNFTVLSVELGSSYVDKTTGANVQKHKIVLQGIDDKTKILTGEAREPLPPTVVVGGVVDDVWVYENSYQGKIEIGLFFPGVGGGKSGGGKSGGNAKPEDVHLKIISFAYSYQKDLAIASGVGELSYDAFYEEARNMAVHMWADYQHIKTL